MHATVARPGFLVVDSELNLLAANSDAVEILTFPDASEESPEDSVICTRIRQRLIDRRAATGCNFVSRFKSAKRTYVCRSFALSLRSGSDESGSPAMLLLLERNSSPVATMNDLAERFGLTLREQETVKLLLQGLTSKEIADRMKISPNTVKAFIRLVMVKMKVSTRSGIVGKIAEEAQNSA
jgi:DNA-binding CsgD family transcriptional regulator